LFTLQLTRAEKYKATKADTDEKEKNARRTLRNGLSISSRRRCLVVNPPNFSPRLSSALLLGVEKSGGDCVTLAAAADFGFRAVNASVHGESDAIDSRRKRRFIAAASVDVVDCPGVCSAWYGVGVGVGCAADDD
jgi:hypothetical protein